MTLFKMTLGGTTAEGRWSFGFHTTNTGDDPAAALTKFQTGVAAMWAGGIDAFMSTNITYDLQTVVSINQSTGVQIARADGAVSDAGTTANEDLPAQVSLCISLKTALATRAGRGRIYLPPYDVTEMDTGRLVAADQTTTQTKVKAMFDSLISAGHTPVLYGRTAHSVNAITSLGVGDVFDTQRRRRDAWVENRITAAI